MPQSPPSDLKSLSQVSKELNIPYSTLRTWHERGILDSAAWKVGQRTLYSVEGVRKLITPKPKQLSEDADMNRIERDWTEFDRDPPES